MTKTRLVPVLLAAALALGACGPAGDVQSAPSGEAAQSAAEQGPEPESGQSGEPADASGTAQFFSTEALHTMEIDYDPADFAQSGGQEWVEATVTIDGQIFERAGVRVRDTATTEQDADRENPQTQPWVVGLDVFVPGQTYSGRSRFIVHDDTTATAINEALATALLSEAGVPAQKAAFTRFSVRGGEESLRLVTDTPEDPLWNAEAFAGQGYLYKAEPGGDYTYRGHEADAYQGVFTQEYDGTDIVPLANFLRFINQSTDREFAGRLDAYLDTDAFATYLAMQDLVANPDDVDGQSNDSYLHYDLSAARTTVVAGDPQAAFSGVDMPARSNVLVDRFLTNPDFAALVEDKALSLTANLFDSGFASELLYQYAQLLTDQAGDLVDEADILSTVEATEKYLSGSGVQVPTGATAESGQSGVTPRP